MITNGFTYIAVLVALAALLIGIEKKTNWKFFNGKWHILIKSEWIECEKPKYELLYEAELNVA